MIDPETFRTKSWPERVAIFNAMSAEEKATLVRGCISSWLEAHRTELSDLQVAILEENIAAVTPELYGVPARPELRSRLAGLEKRTAAILSKDQMREALTMHWEPPR